MQRQMILLRNLNCPDCADKLERAAQALPGMRRARVSFGTGALNVEYDPSILGMEEIQQLIGHFGLDAAATLPVAF